MALANNRYVKICIIKEICTNCTRVMRVYYWSTYWLGPLLVKDSCKKWEEKALSGRLRALESEICGLHTWGGDIASMQTARSWWSTSREVSIRKFCDGNRLKGRTAKWKHVFLSAWLFLYTAMIYNSIILCRPEDGSLFWAWFHSGFFLMQSQHFSLPMKCSLGIYSIST